MGLRCNIGMLFGINLIKTVTFSKKILYKNSTPCRQIFWCVPITSMIIFPIGNMGTWEQSPGAQQEMDNHQSLFILRL